MTKLYIGIDLGHGETSAAFPQENVHQEYSVVRLNTADGNMQVIPTQIILTNTQMEKLKGRQELTYEFLKEIGPFRIGDCPAYVPDGERFFYFKVAPKDFDKPCGATAVAKACGITHGMVMTCFVHALVENIFFYNQDVLLQNKRFETELLVGCPTTADWTAQQAQEAYTNLVALATGVSAVRIIPESRAAMFSSVENNVNSISASKGAVVFDFGSSTADCTYMLLGRKILEFSWTLGAFEVERMMMREALKESIQQNGVFDPDQDKLMEVADGLRTAKEAYYNGMYPPKGKSIICEFQDTDTGDVIENAVKVGQSFMEQVTGLCETNIVCDSIEIRTGSWRGLCREFFQEAKKKIEASTYKDEMGEDRPCTVGTVVLTGGASKMDFIEPICKEIYQDCTVLLNRSNPSHTVSNGLCWIAITDSNLPACKSAAIQQVMGSGIVDKLIQKLSDTVFLHAKELATKEVITWAEQPGDTATLTDLKNQLKDVMDKPEAETQLKQLCDESISNWKQDLSAVMEQAVNAQAKKLYSEEVAQSLMLPKDIWTELDNNVANVQINVLAVLDGIRFDNILPDTLSEILSALTLGLSRIVEGLLGGMFGPSDPWNAPRTRDARQKIASKIGTTMDKKKQEVIKSFVENLQQQTATLKDAISPMLDAALAVVTLQQFNL